MNSVRNSGNSIDSNNINLSKKNDPNYRLSVDNKFFSSYTKNNNHFNIPLSFFRYNDYSFDYFISCYNILRKVFEDIKQIHGEKFLLNLFLSVLIIPYIAFISFGLILLNKKKEKNTKINLEKKKLNENIAKKIMYLVFAVMMFFINIIMLIVFIIPAIFSLITFYFFNKNLVNSLFSIIKTFNELYKNKFQAIEIYFHEIDINKSDIILDIEIKAPSHFDRLIRDLFEGKDKIFFIKDSNQNNLIKFSVKIHLKNGLVYLRDPIKNILFTLGQVFSNIIDELLKLDNNDVAYLDKIKILLNKFRINIMNSIDHKLINYLIQDAYRVALIQAVKLSQQRRKEDFILEEKLKKILIEQELKNKGKELPTEKEIIKKDLGISLNNLNYKTLPLFRAKRRKLILEKKIVEKKVVDIYEDTYPEEAKEVFKKSSEIIKNLKNIGKKKYYKISKKLKEVFENKRNRNLKDNLLKRKLEDLFKIENKDQYVYRELIKSRIKKSKVILNRSTLKVEIKQNLISEFFNLNTNICSYHEINLLLEKMYSEIIKCKTKSLFYEQGKSMENDTGILTLFTSEDEKPLIKKIISYREEVKKHLNKYTILRKLLKKQNIDFDIEKNNIDKKSLGVELLELCLKNNQEIIKTLDELEYEKDQLLINEKIESDYKQELDFREKIKFSIIEDSLVEILKEEFFYEEKIKDLLQKAELEYYLAEKCIKYPIIKTKSNIKYFCQVLLSSLIDELLEKIINHVPKDNVNSIYKIWDSFKVSLGYIRVGLEAIKRDKSVERKALKIAHSSYKEIEIFLQYFESSYEEIGCLIGNLFSDEGKTFKDNILPKIENYLSEMLERFFKDVEINLISYSSKDIKNSQEIVETKLDNLITLKINPICNNVTNYERDEILYY